MNKGNKLVDRLPLALVLIMVVLLLIPAVVTLFTPKTAVNLSSDYYLTWDEYLAGNGITEWNWNDAADAIEATAIHAADLYEQGDTGTAYEYAKATYWGYYETTGFERNTMSYIQNRVSSVELQFTALRKAVKKDLGVEAVRAEAEKLSAMLHEDALILSPEGPIAKTSSSGTSVGTSTTTASGASSVAVFLGSFGIILREGLEAILVVGAIVAYLIKSGNRRGVVPVYIGAALAVVCSFALAALLAWLKAINPETAMSQEIIEGFAALIAVAVLFYVSNWMVSKSESAAWSGYIEGKVAGSAERGSMFALGFTAWLAVFREGAEVILFYQPMLSEGHPDMVWLGFGVGCAALVVVFLLIRLLSIRLPVKPFFLGTSILMAIMTICFLGSGIKELMEGGVFDDFAFMLTSPAWLQALIPYNDVMDVLGLYPLLGTLVPQLILLVITVITFVIQIRRNNAIRAASQASASGGAEPETLAAEEANALADEAPDTPESPESGQ